MSAASFTLPASIRTPRLHLRALRVADAPDQVAAVAASLPELSPWLQWAQRAQTLPEARENLAEAARHFAAGEQYDYGLRTREGEFAGRVSLFALDRRIPAGEIGYWLATAHTGRGFMREAVAALVNTALSAGLRRVEIRCDPRNVRSARIAESLGFVREGVLRGADLDPTDPTRVRDTAVYARIH